MKKCSKYPGLDVHKDTIAVAVAGERGGEPRYGDEIANRAAEVRRLRRVSMVLSGNCGLL